MLVTGISEVQFKNFDWDAHSRNLKKNSVLCKPDVYTDLQVQEMTQLENGITIKASTIWGISKHHKHLSIKKCMIISSWIFWFDFCTLWAISRNLQVTKHGIRETLVDIGTHGEYNLRLPVLLLANRNAVTLLTIFIISA